MAVKNKRGVFFTLTAIALLSLLIVSYAVFTAVKERGEVNRRISSMNNFVSSLEQDLPRKLFISGFRAIFLYEKRILENGTYIIDANATFNEVFFNGTINGVMSLEEQALVDGVTFDDIERDLNDVAEKISVTVDLSNPRISMTQDDPWNVKVQLITDLLIEDGGGLAMWNRTATIDGYIPISNFEDPIYLMNTAGRVAPKVRKTPYTVFSVGGDVTNLLDHTQQFYYLNSTTGPSFLRRLEGNLSADVNGIESLVYLTNLSAQGITLKDKSVVDYIYFSGSNPAASTVAGMPSWFKLDGPHVATYVS